jgi:hypothetical protein
VTLPVGSWLGPYEILSPLGAGGMGEVYKARDTRLERTVAIKVLPDRVSSDAAALTRFEREAKVVAMLSHPNILAIHDVGSEGGVVYAVTELLEGQTLGELLATGPLAPRRIVSISREMAEGLAAAHARGVVHRDLKPENVFVTKDGHVKILDFGLAGDVVALGENGTSAPTEGRLTEPGAVMGTVGYMSPEQVRGQALDHRSDVFSFGAILYEMLSGRRAFKKPTAAETMTAVLNEEPPELPPMSGAVSSLQHVARRCLEKSPESRFQDSRDLVFALEMASEGLGGSGAQPAASEPKARRWTLPAMLGFVVVAAGAAIGALALRTRTPEPPRFQRVTFRRGYVRGARFAPDGRSIVYAAAWEGGALKLYLKHAESPDPIPLEPPDANLLAISPTGELAIALRCEASNNGVCLGTLARVPLTGGSPREVAENTQQADWSKDGELAVVRELPQGSRLEFPPGKVLYQPANGYISFPRVSPDGKRIAFFDHPIWRDDAGFVAVVDRAGRKRILTKRWSSLRGLAWSPSGEEIWFTGADVASRELYAVSLSGKLRALHRSPGSLTLFDVSRYGKALLAREEERNGILAAGPGESAERELSWLDHTNAMDMSADGKLLLLAESSEAAGPNGTMLLRKMDGSPPMRLGEGVGQLSPDGKRVLNVVLGSGAPIKILPVGPGEPTTVKMDGLELLDGGWFPDSRRLLVSGRPSGQPLRFFHVDPDTGAKRPIAPLEGASGTDFGVTPDSRHILARRSDGTWAFYPIDGGAPAPVAGMVPGEELVTFSRDSRALFVARPREIPLRVFRIDLSSGTRSHWRDFEPADKAGLSYVRNVLLSADGSAYAYQYRRWLSDLYIVEGLK